MPPSDTKPRKRRERDAYFTPLSAVNALACLQPMKGRLLDPTCGDATMAAALADRFDSLVLNDLEPQISQETRDRLMAWQRTDPAVRQLTIRSSNCLQPPPAFGLWFGADWIVTNPPWNQAAEIAERACAYAMRGLALLLRLSFLEATRSRLWLRKNPPRRIIVLPRISFTGDGRHDSVVPAWFLWGDDVCAEDPVRILSKEDLSNYGDIRTVQRSPLAPVLDAAVQQ